MAFNITPKAAPNNIVGSPFKTVVPLENGGGAKKLGTGLSSLVSTSTNPLERAGRKGYITDLFLDELIPYVNHPFRLYNQEKMQELADSIKEYGLLNPILVRPHRDNGKYEILAGHNRTEASKLVGKTEIAARVIEVDDDEAAIIVAESNLKQREKLLPSEKAFAYKIQMDALKSREKKRNDNGLESSSDEGFEDLYQCGTKNSGLEMSNKTQEGRTTIFRYIRLVNLIKDLLDMVDEETIPFLAGVEISYLNETEQLIVYHILTENEGVLKLDVPKATALRERTGKLTDEMVRNILAGVENFIKAKQKNTLPKSPYSKVFKKVIKSLDKLSEGVSVIPDEKELEKCILTAVKNYLETLENTLEE